MRSRSKIKELRNVAQGLTLDGFRWQGLVNTVTKIWVPKSGQLYELNDYHPFRTRFVGTVTLNERRTKLVATQQYKSISLSKFSSSYTYSKWYRRQKEKEL
jgi:hypothetical protein